MSRAFKALYNGPACPDCEGFIKEGESVRYDDADQLVHAPCPGPPREAPVCPECWVAHAGECF